MARESDFERRVRSRLRGALDSVEPPTPSWANAPARGRVGRPVTSVGRVLLVAAVIAVGGAVLVWSAGGGRAPSVVAPSAPTSVTRTPSASATAGSSASASTPITFTQVDPWVATGSAGDWSVAFVPADRRVTGVFDVGDGLVTGDLDGPVVWRANGSSFHLERLPVADPGLSRVDPSLATASGSTIVLAGGGETALCAHPFGAAAWAFDGGWRAKPFDLVDCSRIATTLVSGRPGDVWASTFTTGEIYGVWQTSDGIHWSNRTPAGAVDAQLTSVAYGAGRYLVGGRSGTEGVVWSSLDGVDWQTGLLSADRSDLPSVAALPGVALAIAPRSDGTTGIWTSRDGTSWLALDPRLVPSGEIDSVEAIGGAFVLIGRAGGVPSLWTSATGLAWRPVALPGPADATVHAVGVFGDRLAVIATVDNGSTSHDAAWLRSWPIP